MPCDPEQPGAPPPALPPVPMPPPRRMWLWRMRRFHVDRSRLQQLECWILGQLSQTTTTVGIIDAVALLLGRTLEPGHVEAVATVLGFVSPVVLLLVQDRSQQPPGSC